ncbi:uncharacterized protein LOC130628740 [Hydractinia symbiolongicarpus]|uniref:uncharacterized protein LOC130628740 n=1 Tax=Hydractinia symbiolongicarpus TaxID=13093 RepID=UPI00254A2275|nr:uncharacterized protein LOC130628740 [Hydractinia symbiolongicarpus]
MEERKKMYFLLFVTIVYQYGFSEASTCESKHKCKETKTSATFAYISMSKVDNVKLNGTILSSQYVNTKAACNKLCAMHDGCLSTNVGPNNISTLACELLAEDKYTNVSQLVNATGWVLFTAANACDDNPCKGTCLPNHLDNTHICFPPNAYYQPLLNFTFDNSFECFACNTTAFWGDGVRINDPGRITKVLYFPDTVGGAINRVLYPEGCFKHLSSAFPGNCDSNGFVFSFWYRTFMRHPNDVAILNRDVNGFAVALTKRNAQKSPTWHFILRTEKNRYKVMSHPGPDASQWVHLLFKFDIANDLFSVYMNGKHTVDGKKETRNIARKEIGVTDVRFTLYNGKRKRYTGMFDDILYYNRLLSNKEILTLHKVSSHYNPNL